MKQKFLFLTAVIFVFLTACRSADAAADTEGAIMSDGLAFKAEYEALNGQPHPTNAELSFIEIDIAENNPFVFAEFDEINELAANGTGIIYLGFPECPWCRAMLPVLTNAAIDFGVDKILYRNILDERNILERYEGEIIEIRAGEPGYYRLLEILGDIAPVYTGLDDESIRRIFVPALIFVKDGNVIAYEESLETFQERVRDDSLGSWQPMNEAEVNELTRIYVNYFNILFNDANLDWDSEIEPCPIC
jgi:thiol-disulfide isomerase/thioredoxin